VQQPLRKAMMVIVAIACLGFTSVIAWAEPSAGSGMGAAIGKGQDQSVGQGRGQDQVAGQGQVADPSADLQQQITRLVDKLSKQPGFELWSQARWDSYPLGPGIHGWVVILTKDGKECGYLIMNAATDGTYKLGEYGTGSNPLFGVSALAQSLQLSELSVGVDSKVKSKKVERLYVGPWHAVWSMTGIGETKLLDAATGDTLPIRWDGVSAEFASLGQVGYSGAGENDSVARTLQSSAFDPYERLNWLIDEPMPTPSLAEISTIVSSPDSARLTFVVQPFDGQTIYAYAVSGVQVWDTADPYIRLSINNNDRYIPYSQMIQLGHFYR
jgi:hypothetical protein